MMPDKSLLHMIKELRDRTGVGMGKCKEALEEAKGDMELAICQLAQGWHGLCRQKRRARAPMRGLSARPKTARRSPLLKSMQKQTSL